MATKRSQRSELRVLLDQGFPNPPGFDVANVDKNLRVEHLSRWRPDLSRRSTPDWVLYCEASMAGFHALVTRDFSQAEQGEEMVCLSRLRDFHVVSWKERMDDPIVEWGQLLAYLPEVRRFLTQGVGRVIFLPKPRLQLQRNVHDPKEFINRIAVSTGVSVAQVRREAQNQMLDWEQTVGDDDGRLARHLGF